MLTLVKLAIDHFGLVYQNAGISYNIGQQGLIFDNTSYVGREMSVVKASNITGTAGNTEFMAVYGQMYATPFLTDERLDLAALSFATKVGKNTKMGASYAHSSQQGLGSMNNYALLLSSKSANYSYS